MRKWLLSLAIIWAFAVVAFAQPKIFIPESKWDFGHVPQKSTLTHDYWVKNIGTDTLKISRIKSG